MAEQFANLATHAGYLAVVTIDATQELVFHMYEAVSTSLPPLPSLTLDGAIETGTATVGGAIDTAQDAIFRVHNEILAHIEDEFVACLVTGLTVLFSVAVVAHVISHASVIGGRVISAPVAIARVTYTTVWYFAKAMSSLLVIIFLPAIFLLRQL